MTHEQAVKQLETIQSALFKLENTDVLRSTRCIVKMMALSEKLSSLIRYHVGAALDERDSLQLEF